MAVAQDEISLVQVSNGDDGRGILGTPVATYAQSTSGTIPPTTWSATRPNVPAGQYLWTRVVTTYTDNTTSETQTPTLMGKPGESGLGIKEKSINYASGTSGNTPPTTGWQETIPTVAANQYLWTRTTLVYTDDSKTDAYSVGKMGANGADAQLLYLTASAENVAFNADDTPKTTQTINISAKLQNVTGPATFTAIPYIGNTAQTAITLGGSGNTRTLTSSQWTNKEWTLIAITATLDNLNDTLSIVKVKDGAKGDKGSDGIAGKDGVGISDTTITYAQSSNGTNPPSTGWTASVPTLIKGQYLWTKTVWSYTDSTTETGYTVSYNAKDGNDGNDGIAGKDGVGISATKIEYVGSTSGTVKPTTGWSTTIPAVAEGQYLWTRTTWIYTDNTSEMGYSAAKMGAKGDKGDKGDTGSKGDPGENGVSVTGTQVQYVQSSNMTEPTTGWSDTRPTPVPGQWLWTRSRNIFSDGTYGSWATVPTLIGREAIVISATAPSNPSTGTLWQTPSDPNVKQWDGTKWIDWGISINNLVAENVTIENGVFKRIDGLEIYGALIVNTFDVWTGFYVNDTDQLWRKGTTSVANSEVAIDYQNYNKATGAIIETGSTVAGVGGNSTLIATPQGTIKRSADFTVNGIELIDDRASGTNTAARMKYSDLIEVATLSITAASGWSQYAASGISHPTASRTGRMVQLSGAFKPNSDIAGSADQVTMSSRLPLWARPKEEITVVQQGSGMNRYRLVVTIDGYITMSRYGTTSYATAIKGAYLNISVAYAGADIF